MSSAQSSRAPSIVPRGLIRIGFTLLVTSLALWYLWSVLSGVGLSALSSRLRHADLTLSAAVVAAIILRYLTMALRWEVLARRQAPVGLWQIASVMMAGSFVALVTPVVRIAGPILKAYYLSKETGRPRARFYGTIVADQAANFTIFGVVVCTAGAMASVPGEIRLTTLAGVSLLVALVLGLYLSYRMLKRISEGNETALGLALKAIFGEGEKGGYRDRLVGWWEDLAQALAASVVGSPAWWQALAFSAAGYGLLIAGHAAAFHAVGADVTIGTVTLGIAAAGVAQVLVAAPNGPGVTEASLLGVFMAFGLDPETASAGVLLARFLNYAVLVPWGGISFLRLQRRYGVPRAGVSAAAA